MQIEVSFEIIPERLATLQRVGNGREEPNTNPCLVVRCSLLSKDRPRFGLRG